MNPDFDTQVARVKLFALLVAVVSGLGLYGTWRLAGARWRQRSLSKTERAFWRASACLLVMGVACFIWGFIEPDLLSESHYSLRTSKLPAGSQIRIVHLSDLHVDARTRALSELPGRVNALKPDLVIHTGDTLNAAAGLPVWREVMQQIQAPRFAVKGNHDVWYWHELDLFKDVAQELSRKAVSFAEGRLVLCGAPYGLGGAIHECLSSAPASALRIVAYHTPDMIEELAPEAPDLYLAGHTHGGQIRLPFFGALVTMSRFDKKYEMGLYQHGPVTLHVTRGIGVEPHAPRMRFLCRPEIAVIDLVGTGPALRPVP